MSFLHLKEKGITGWKRTLIILGIILIAFVILIIIFISPIAKYAIEKYGSKYTGRQVKTGVVYVNPFTGYIHIGDLKISEPQSDSIFASADGVNLNIALLKLLSKTYEVSSFILNEPYIKVIKDKKRFNFSDLLEKQQQDTAKEEQNKEPMHLNILNIKINDGLFRFHEKQTPVDYYIQKLNFDSDGKYWNSDSIRGRFSFIPGKGPGDVKGDFWIDLNKKDFRLSSVGKKLNMDLFEQYLKDLSNYGTMRALFGFDIKAAGNLNNQKAVKLKGRFVVDDFHFGKNPKEDYASFEKFKATIIDLEPLNKRYYFDSLQLKKPFILYEMYDTMSNLDHMFGKSGENVKQVKADPEKFNLILKLADYIKELFQDIIHSDYRINYLDLENGDLKYNDYSLTEKFSIALNPLDIKANLVSKDKRKVNIILKSQIQPYGNFNAEVGMDPKNARNYYLTYNFDKIPASVFNPYIVSYSSYPLDRGLIEMNGDWKILGDSIRSMNHFLAIDPRVSQRVKKKENKWIPMPLIMSFIVQRENVIDYKIPITGYLKNPNFHLHDVLMNLLRNILLKPPTTPYGIDIKNVETKIEKSLMLDWPVRQTHLKDPEEKFARRISDFLKSNKDAAINVKPNTYEQKEKEYILFFEAKKKYYLDNTQRKGGPISEKDSSFIDKMSTKDPAFIKYLNKHVKDTLIFTRQEKCRKLIGEETVDNKYHQLLKDREEDFMNYFKKKGTDKQVNILPNQDIVPFNGFSYYKIDYKGEIPKSLEKAYQKLIDYNNNSPRKKYEPLRKIEKPKT